MYNQTAAGVYRFSQLLRMFHPALSDISALLTALTSRPQPTLTGKLEQSPMPTTVKEVQRLTGMANYYRRFKPKDSELAVS